MHFFKTHFFLKGESCCIVILAIVLDFIILYYSIFYHPLYIMVQYVLWRYLDINMLNVVWVNQGSTVMSRRTRGGHVSHRTGKTIYGFVRWCNKTFTLTLLGFFSTEGLKYTCYYWWLYRIRSWGNWGFRGKRLHQFGAW